MSFQQNTGGDAIVGPKLCEPSNRCSANSSPLPIKLPSDCLCWGRGTTLHSSRPRAVRWLGASAPRASWIRVSVWPAREGTWRLSERTLCRRKFVFHIARVQERFRISSLPPKPLRISLISVSFASRNNWCQSCSSQFFILRDVEWRSVAPSLSRCVRSNLRQ